MNAKLIQALLQYFELDQWKKTKGLSKTPPFNTLSDRELQDHILAMARLGILEKREGTTTTNALFRLSTDRAVWWRDALSQSLQKSTQLVDLDFRTLYILYVIGEYQLAHHRPPRQADLYYRNEDGLYRGLLNEWLETSGAIAEDPHGIASPVQIRAATLKLAELGYMVERGKPGDRRPFLLTEKGLELVQRLQGMHWSKWPVSRR
jgi:hypothetical protein